MTQPTSTNLVDLLSPEHRSFLDRTFNSNSANFGGWSMEGEEAAPEGTQEPAKDEGEVSPTDESKEPENGSESGEEEKPESDDGLSLEDAKAALAKVRREAATTRTKLRELEAKFDGAKTPEEVEAIKAEIAKDNATEARALMIENVALSHNLPEDLAATLAGMSGETREDFEQHAKVLAKYAPVEPTDDPPLSGGLRPDETPDKPFDARANARRHSSRTSRWS